MFKITIESRKEMKKEKYIAPEDVFANLERLRRDGSLSRMVAKSPIKYQSSVTHHGYLEQIDERNQVTVGRWRNGKFIPINPLSLP